MSLWVSLSGDRSNPVPQVVAACDSCDLVVADLEERRGPDGIFLPMSGGERAVGLEVFAGTGEFGGAPVAVDHHHQIGDLLAVAGVHVGFESAEGINSMLGVAFIDVMPHILIQQGEHGFRIMGVEGIKVGADQAFGAGHVQSLARRIMEPCFGPRSPASPPMFC